MKKIVIRGGKIIKHNFKGKVLEKARVHVVNLEDGKYEVIDKKENLDFKKL